MRRSRRAGVVLCVVLCTGCVIDDPVIQSAAPTATVTGIVAPTPTAVPAPTAAPTPTLPPVATVAPTPTTAPPPTPTPTATSTPPPPTPTPLPTTFPSPAAAPTLRQPGVIAVPVDGVTTFLLEQARPILQLPGHTLIYVDDDRQAEVDLFTPVADREGAALSGYAEVIDEIVNAPNLAGLTEVAPTTIDGFPARIFDGTGVFGDRVFFTGEAFTGNENAGWSPPLRLRMWVIDGPDRPIIVTAESLEDPGQFDDSLAIATTLLDSLELG